MYFRLFIDWSDMCVTCERVMIMWMIRVVPCNSLSWSMWDKKPDIIPCYTIQHVVPTSSLLGLTYIKTLNIGTHVSLPPPWPQSSPRFHLSTTRRWPDVVMNPSPSLLSGSVWYINASKGNVLTNYFSWMNIVKEINKLLIIFFAGLNDRQLDSTI